MLSCCIFALSIMLTKLYRFALGNLIKLVKVFVLDKPLQPKQNKKKSKKTEM